VGNKRKCFIGQRNNDPLSSATRGAVVLGSFRRRRVEEPWEGSESRICESRERCKWCQLTIYSELLTMMNSLLLLLGLATADAFVAPANFVARGTSLNALPESILSSLMLADEQAVSDAMSYSDVLGSDVMQQGGGIMETVTSVLRAITGVVFLLAGLTYVTAAVLIPQAAKQLENQTKELDPDLWDEYQAKLEPGQTLDQRPDLMQELGDIMQKKLSDKFDEAQSASNEQSVSNEKADETQSASNEQAGGDGQSLSVEDAAMILAAMVSNNVLDAEIVSKETTENEDEDKD
jgi:hypothetical protein